MEGENPTRRYKWFRPRQAAWGYCPVQATPTNWGTVALYNNSPGTEYLVLRLFYTVDSGNQSIMVSRRQSRVGTVLLNSVFPLLPDGAAAPGQLIVSDEAQITSGIIFDHSLQFVTTGAMLPMLICPPGWAIVFQQLSQTVPANLGVLFEHIEPEELDFMDW